MAPLIIVLAMVRQEPSLRLSAPMVNVISGGVSGLIETTLSYPLDVAKTRQQFSTSIHGQGTVSIIRQILATSGVPGLYSGLSAPLIAEVPRRALKFGANGAYQCLAQDSGIFLESESNHSVLLAFLCGGLTGVTETVLHTPFERVKTLVVQSAQQQQLEQQQSQLRPLECGFQLVRSGGLTSLYRGWEAYVVRQFVWNSVFFGCIALGREVVVQQTAATNFVVGLLSGSLGTCLNNPMDVAKTRIQAQDSATRPRFVVSVMVEILKTEGLRGWCRGLLPRLYRSAPGHGLLYMSFEFVSGKLRAM